MIRKIAFAYFLSIVLFLLPSCDNREIVDNYYNNYEHLGKDEPGNWIPEFIPRSAVNIKERHKIDTGAELLTFYFEKYADIALDKFCERVAADEIELPQTGFLNVTWWPDSLYRDRAKKEDIDLYEFYHCERQAFFAVKRVNGYLQAFYWRLFFK